MKPLTHKLYRELWQRKTLVIALTVILAIGITVYISMSSIYQTLSDAQNQYYHQSQLADFTVDFKATPEDFATRLRHIPNVKAIMGRVTQPIMVSFPRDSLHKTQQPIPGMAVSMQNYNQQPINKLLLYQGSWFTSPDAHQAIVLTSFAAGQHLKPGDHISVRIHDKQYNIMIVGTAYSPEYVFVKQPGHSFAPDFAGYSVLFMPKGFMQSASDLENAYNQVVATTADQSEPATTATMNQVSKQLQSAGVIQNTLQKDLGSVQMLHEELKNIHVSTTMLPTIFLALACLVVNVLITRLIKQQRVIIGTLKAMGYSRWALAKHYLSFGLVIGILGGIFGIIFGLILESVLCNFYKGFFKFPGIEFNLFYLTIAKGMAISILAALIGCISAVRQVTKLSPAEAMRPESPTKARRSILERMPKVWNRISLMGKLVIRSMQRNPFRCGVTFLCTFIATALLFSTLAMYQSISHLMSYEFDVLQKQDVALTFREPLGPEILSSLSRLPNVSLLQPALSVSAKLSNGPYTKETEIMGLPAGHELLDQPITLTKADMQIPARGVVLSETLANILHLKLGDPITIKLYMGGEPKVQSFVVGISKTYLGATAYANQQWLSQLVGDNHLTNSVLIKLRHQQTPALVDASASFASLININFKDHDYQLLNQAISGFMTSFVVLMIIFAGAIAIASILNNALISINEREREIATYAVIGMTRKEIFLLFLREGIFLNALGILFGLIGGVYFAAAQIHAYNTQSYHFPLTITPLNFIVTFLIMTGFVTLAYSIIYRIIQRTDWFSLLNTRE